MRVGNNPLKFKETNEPNNKIVISAVTHLPNYEGYHAQRLEVVKLCLESMRKNAGVDDIQVAIWDNGSCNDFRKWLLGKYKPDTIVLSRNVGKMSALKGLSGMFNKNTIMSFSDDDMLFYPGWLEASINVMRAFNVPCVVSGYPVVTAFRWGCKNTIDWGKAHGEVAKGKLIPKQWDIDFCNSIGRNYDDQIRTTVADFQYKMKYHGVEVYLTSHHCQYTTFVDTVHKYHWFSNMALEDEKPFDIALDENGVLRLTTAKRYSRHIGNIIDDDIMGEAKNMGLL